MFYHNGKLLYKGGSKIYNITNVTVNDGGLYKCVPSNVTGRGEEASLNITVTGGILFDVVVKVGIPSTLV